MPTTRTQTPRSPATTRSTTAPGWPPPSSCCANGWTSARPSGRPRSPAFRQSGSASSPGRLGETAMHHGFELPSPWTDAWGVEHATVIGRPVAFHAMRGLAAHSNGFQTTRALAILMSVLGHDRPPRRLPPQGALPAPHRSQLPDHPQPGAGPAEYAAAGGAARLPGASGGARGQRRTARRSASTRPSRGSIRCRRTA